MPFKMGNKTQSAVFIGLVIRAVRKLCLALPMITRAAERIRFVEEVGSGLT